MKNRLDKLGIGKLETTPVDLSTLSDVVKNEVVKKTEYNVKVKDIENKIPDFTNVATTATLNVKIN